MSSRSLLFLSTFFPLVLLAGNSDKRATAVRTPAPPRIDGVLDESEWNLAVPINDFVQSFPLEGNPPTQRTEIRILYDDDALYFGCTMFDTEPSKIVARLARRDEEIQSDRISIRIDSYHDHQTAFEFTLNAAGVKVDILQFNDARYEDESWDVVWDAETRITGEGWVAEMRIPFKVLRFPDTDAQEWGIQFIRHITRNQETQMWVLIRVSESGFVSRFGHLEGIEGIRPRMNLQILPYVVGNNRYLAEPQGRQVSPDFTSSLGMDLKYKPTSDWTVDATFNPDFGQVEADPEVLNLSTFETFYPEKRPFFVEGSQILNFTTFGHNFGPGLYYSRRIGRALEAEAPDGGYVLHEPRFATILGAAKLSGRTPGGLSVGALEAVTRDEYAVVVDSLGREERTMLEPIANYSLVRLRQDFLGNSNAGLMLTNVSRRGRRPAFTGGIDWDLNLLDNMYRIDGFLAGSHTTTSEDMLIQGAAGKLGISKEGGVHWRGSVSADFTSPKFNINDIGFFRRPNDFGGSADLEYRDDLVTSWRRRWEVSARYHIRHNFDGAEINRSVGLDGFLMFANFWEIDGGVSYDAGKYDDRETRGNGLFRKPRKTEVDFGVESDPRQDIVGELNASVAGDSRDGQYFSLRGEFEFKIASNFDIGLFVERNQADRQFSWVANVDDPVVSPTTSSIFADRSTIDWDMTTRWSMVFTRNLTLQIYLQLFFAKGKFENSVRMVGEDSYVPYQYLQQDFNEVSLNSNVVLRWEYLPGSTAYLVWSQSRRGNSGTYNSTFRENVKTTFRLPSENVLLLKISYWLDV